MERYFVGNLFLILGIFISLVAQIYVSFSYRKYKNVKNSKGISGLEVAQQILENNGLKDIYVVETKGVLSDHYDPSRKVVRLSSEIFKGTTIASASVAAHEVGHALQDKEGYSFMKLRSKLFPLVKFSSYGGYIAILIGVIFSMLELIWIGIGLEIIILLFQLVTLPVEFNASTRARDELTKLGIFNNDEVKSSNSMLRAAAYTYVASVLTTLLQILRLVLIFADDRR